MTGGRKRGGMNCTDRAERTSRTLKNHPQLRSVELTYFLLRKIRQIFPFIPDISAGHKSGRSKQSHSRLDQRRLSGTGFPHNTEYLPLSYREAHIFHRFKTVICNIDMFVT